MTTSAEKPNYDFEVFYDGECPLCAKEIRMLQRLDRHGRIRFTDIAAPEFDAASIGVPFDNLMAEIHGRLPSGKVIKGVEVFRQLYGAVGFRWLTACTRLPGLSHFLDWGYLVFARNRLKLTGRCENNACGLKKPEPE